MSKLTTTVRSVKMTTDEQVKYEQWVRDLTVVIANLRTDAQILKAKGWPVMARNAEMKAGRLERRMQRTIALVEQRNTRTA